MVSPLKLDNSQSNQRQVEALDDYGFYFLERSQTLMFVLVDEPFHVIRI